MTDLAIPVAAAATLVWLGMVLAISLPGSTAEVSRRRSRVAGGPGDRAHRVPGPQHRRGRLGGGHRGMPERRRSNPARCSCSLR